MATCYTIMVQELIVVYHCESILKFAKYKKSVLVWLNIVVHYNTYTIHCYFSITDFCLIPESLIVIKLSAVKELVCPSFMHRCPFDFRFTPFLSENLHSSCTTILFPLGLKKSQVLIKDLEIIRGSFSFSNDVFSFVRCAATDNFSLTLYEGLHVILFNLNAILVTLKTLWMLRHLKLK